MPRGFGRVDVFAAPTVKLDGLLVRDVSEPYGEERLRLTQHSGTAAKVGAFVFFKLKVRREDVGVAL